MAPPGRMRGPIFWQRKKIDLCVDRPARRRHPATVRRGSTSREDDAGGIDEIVTTTPRRPGAAGSERSATWVRSLAALQARAIDVDGQHRRAFVEKPEGNCPSDAARRPGDDRAPLFASLGGFERQSLLPLLLVFAAGLVAPAAGVETHTRSTGSHRGPHRGIFARVFEESGARKAPWMK